MIPSPERLIAAAFVALAPAPAVAGGQASNGVASLPSPGMNPRLSIPRADASRAIHSHTPRHATATLAAKPVGGRPLAGPAKDAPEYNVHRKSEWFDDQGFRFGASGVAYRRRF